MLQRHLPADPASNGRGSGTDATVARLEAERPIPHPAFRGKLRRQLATTPRSASLPRRLPLLITGYAAGGLLLLAVDRGGGRGPLRRLID